MSTLEAWIVMNKAALDVLWTNAHVENPPSSLVLITNGVRGYWRDITPDDVVNVIGTEQEIDDFVAIYGAVITAVYSWTQGDGLDNLDAYQTVPPGVLAVMKDHEGAIPPTFSNPNWGHVFLGQEERIFAGQFSDEFTEEFL